MTPSSMDIRNSRDVRRWVRAPLRSEPLHAVTARSANSTAPHALFCECWPFGPRSRSYFLCLDLKVRLVHAGNLSRFRANGGRRSIRTKFSAHAKMRVSIVSPSAPSHLLMRVSVPVIDAIEKGINRHCIALWDQRWIDAAPGISAWARKNSSSNVL
jgi:hypothetical protein